MRKFEKVINANPKTKLPIRSTKTAAGYDFFASKDVIVPPMFNGQNFYSKVTFVPTGIKAKFNEDEVLTLYDRSSNPSKRGIVLSNSVGIIDSDYYGNKSNDGEIMGMFWNFTDKPYTIHAGDKIMQGIFSKFLLTDDDAEQEKETRKGGIGSTGKK